MLTSRIRIVLAFFGVGLLGGTLSSCGVGCQYVLRSSAVTVEIPGQNSRTLPQVVGEAVLPLGFEPTGNGYASRGRLFSPPVKPVSVRIEGNDSQILVIDSGGHETTFDRRVMEAIAEHVKAAFQQPLTFSPEKQPAFCLGP
jgi:hypothetical protein